MKMTLTISTTAERMQHTVFLLGHGFLHRDFTNRREIWHKASPISQTDLFKFLEQYHVCVCVYVCVCVCVCVWADRAR